METWWTRVFSENWFLAPLNAEAVRDFDFNYSKRAETNTNTQTRTRPEDVRNVIMDEALLCV